MQITGLISFTLARAALLTRVSALPNPAPAAGFSDLTLTPRDIGYLIFSNGCTPGTSLSGFPSCKDMWTMKLGAEGEYKDCHDSSVSFKSSCEIADADNDLDTPMGKGFFTPDGNECEDEIKTKKGIILSKDVNNLWMYQCYRENYQFSENCGFTWASNAEMNCGLEWK
ncbi:uncharacterized protein BDV17DRAFT_49655 [Aspergillus undulatus]|uniref:uncharacterized protein n=1 Tax=Aspergillus undulatus TaxID=1810928 RepID=UPI003CCDB492